MPAKNKASTSSALNKSTRKRASPTESVEKK